MSGCRPEPGEWRRARHVASENLRALAFAGALVRGDAPALGRLLNEGHRSLAQDYEVSCAELEALAAALTEPAPDGAVLCAGATVALQAASSTMAAAIAAARWRCVKRRFIETTPLTVR